MFRLITIGLLIIISFSSCEDSYNICQQNIAVQLNGGFYKNVGGTDSARVAPNLTISVLGSPSSIYTNTDNISKFSFTLNPAVDSAKYTVKVSSTAAVDTITLFYSTQSVLVSQECGNVNTHTIARVKTTTNKLSAISIGNATVNTVYAENIKLYFN